MMNRKMRAACLLFILLFLAAGLLPAGRIQGAAKKTYAAKTMKFYQYSNKWKEVYSIAYTYKNGRLAALKRTTRQPDVFPAYNETRKYNRDGQLTSTVRKPVKRLSLGVPAETWKRFAVAYSYDEKGNLVKADGTDWDGQKVGGTYTRTCKYTRKNRLKSEKILFWEDIGGGELKPLKTSVTYSYGKNGTTKTSRLTCYNRTCEKKETFDKYGNITGFTFSSSDGGYYSLIYDNTYDSRHRLTQVIERLAETDETTTTTYSYDRKTGCLKKVVKYAGANGSKAMKISRIIYSGFTAID